MNGLHLIAELHDCRCDAGVLTNVDALREACLAVCAVPGLTPVAQAFYQFMDGDQPAGATGARSPSRLTGSLLMLLLLVQPALSCGTPGTDCVVVRFPRE